MENYSEVRQMLAAWIRGVDETGELMKRVWQMNPPEDRAMREHIARRYNMVQLRAGDFHEAMSRVVQSWSIKPNTLRDLAILYDRLEEEAALLSALVDLNDLAAA